MSLDQLKQLTVVVADTGDINGECSSVGAYIDLQSSGSMTLDSWPGPSQISFPPSPYSYWPI